MKILKAVALLIGLAAPAYSNPYYGTSISTVTGTAAMNLSGTYTIAPSSVTASTPTITVSGPSGRIVITDGVRYSTYTAGGISIGTMTLNSINSSFTVPTPSSATFAGTVGVNTINTPLTLTSSMTLSGVPLGVNTINTPLTHTSSITVSNVALGLTGASGNLVGQSSFTASAFFGDGSNLTGLGGVGGNNIWTGTNVYRSTTTVGNTVYTTTASYSSVVFGNCAVVASTAIVAAAGPWSFTNVLSTGTSIVEIAGKMNAINGFWSININNDVGANYTSIGEEGGTSTSNFIINGSGIGSYPNSNFFTATMKIRQPVASSNNVVETGNGYLFTQGAVNQAYTMGGKYAGSAPISVITVNDNAISFTGDITLIYCATANGPY